LSRRTVIIVFSVVALGFVILCASAGAWELILALPLGLLAFFAVLGLYNGFWDCAVRPLILRGLKSQDSDAKPQKSVQQADDPNKLGDERQG
jgi:hypothetical protein